MHAAPECTESTAESAANYVCEDDKKFVDETVGCVRSDSALPRFDPRSSCAFSLVLLVLDSSRAERWPLIQGYRHWFWGVLHLPYEQADEHQCDALGVACLTARDLPQRCFQRECNTCKGNDTLYWGAALHVFEPHRRVAYVLERLRSTSPQPRPHWLRLLEARAARRSRDVRGVLCTPLPSPPHAPICMPCLTGVCGERQTRTWICGSCHLRAPLRRCRSPSRGC